MSSASCVAIDPSVLVQDKSSWKIILSLQDSQQDPMSSVDVAGRMENVLKSILFKSSSAVMSGKILEKLSN